MNQRVKKYLNLINPQELRKTKRIVHVNPTTEGETDALAKPALTLFHYSPNHLDVVNDLKLEKLNVYATSQGSLWLNIDHVNKTIVQQIAPLFSIHPLLQEDIISKNQRAKTDEIDKEIFCVCHMMYFNELENTIESEQISFVLAEKFLISFQGSDARDHFGMVREKLKTEGSKCRSYNIDFLLYSLLDSIVDNYYIVMEKLGDYIEKLEEKISRGETDSYTMNRINDLRKEMILYRRNILPVKDVIRYFLDTDNELIQTKTKRYFKDVYDHISQASDLSDNYLDLVTSIRDLYINQVNLKSNETMKFLAIITSLMAPATVIGGIFGMNFDKIPYLHNTYGFWIAVFLMIFIPILMLLWFRKKGWY
jgi:magnesium transporter